jgi:3-phenylpropionate/trans-cinnamate dioxygenase ferredoxin component
MARHRICAVSDVYPDTMKAFAAGDRRILVARAGDRLFAVDDVCSHANASLALGDMDTDKLTVTCILHGGVFSLETGAVVEQPAGGPLDTFEIFVENDDVIVEI